MEFGDFGVPFDDLFGEGDECLPVGSDVVEFVDAFDVIHESGEVLEVAPECEDIFDGLLDDDGFFEFDELAGFGAVVGVDLLLDLAVEEPAADAG